MSRDGEREVGRQEQWTGCLLGECLGDALGAPVEGQPPEITAPYAAALRPGFVPHGRRGAPFGQYTDDSQLARELLQSYRERRAFDPADYAARVAAIFAEGRIYGCGRATLEAAQRLQRGVPWTQSGTPAPSAGNGSAMRAGPIGLLFADDPAGLVKAAHDQGYCTHRDPRCSAGAVAIAGAVALALRGPEAVRDRAAFLGQLAAWAAPYDDGVADALRALGGWLDRPPEEVTGLVSGFGDAGQGAEQWRGISPFVTSGVLWSLYAFLRTPDDYLATMVTAIAVGGDVDTTAAMAGAISGAYLGEAGLPQELLPHLTDQGTFGLAELRALAAECYEISQRKKSSFFSRLLGR